MKKLHIDSVRKSYNNKVILSDIFLTCEKGETVGLIGRNGSGKSTLLKVIFGVEKAENKFIKIGNKVLHNLGDSRNLINYLPQENFLPHVKIKTLIHLFLSKKNRNKILENKTIYPFLDNDFQVLSGGEKRIIEFFLLLYSEAEFILLDEPFEGVSPIVRELIIEKINKEKFCKGFIITDHDYESIIKLADTIYFLQNGLLKKINDQKDLLDLGYLTKTTYNNL